MLDIGASELLLTVIIAIVVIGPKDLPRALRMAGRWIAKVRRVSGHFRSGVEEMIRQAEMEDIEKKWREKNEAIMKEHPDVAAHATAPASAEAALPDYRPASPDGEAPQLSPPGSTHAEVSEEASPELPLASPERRP